MGNYRQDRSWSDRFIPDLRRVLGPLLLAEAPQVMDKQQNTDLIFIQSATKRIACRVRRWKYFEQYPTQFTLRHRRDSGAETEYSKFIKGFGDWFVYGHATPDESRLARAYIIDLPSLRAQLIQNPRQLKTGETPNGDGTYFKWFDLSSFAPCPPILVADVDEIPPAVGNLHRKAGAA